MVQAVKKLKLYFTRSPFYHIDHLPGGKVITSSFYKRDSATRKRKDGSIKFPKLSVGRMEWSDYEVGSNNNNNDDENNNENNNNRTDNNENKSIANTTTDQLPEQIKLALCRVGSKGELYLVDHVICVKSKDMHQNHSLNVHLNKRKENFYYFMAIDPESKVLLEVEWSIDNFKTSHTGVFRLFSRNTSKNHIISRMKLPLPEVSSTEKNSIILKVLDTTKGANDDDMLFNMLSSKRMRMTPHESNIV